MATLTDTPPRESTRARPARRSRWSDKRRQDLRTAILFLAPVACLIIFVRFLPAIQNLQRAMYTSVPGQITPPEFVGFDNFVQLLDTPSFWSSLKLTLVFSAIINPLQIFISLLLAVLLTRSLPMSGLWRTLIFLPAAIPMASSSVVWGYALRPDGPMNGVLGLLGINAQPFLTSPDQALASIMLIASWIGVGYWMVFLVAGINDVPQVYYEAAKIDGAGHLRSFVSITLPLIKRPLLLVLVADTVANFTLFVPMDILTDGGPQGSTSVLMYDVYSRTYVMSDPHLASAELIVLLLILVIVVAIQFRLLRPKEDR